MVVFGNMQAKQGAKIVGRGDRNFAAVLDDLLIAAEMHEDAAPKPSIPFDYLAVADELHSGRIKVSTETIDAEYRENDLGDLAAEFGKLLDQNAMMPSELAKPADEKLLPTDPESIAAELGLGRLDASPNYSKLRRSFAFSNHPDRVAPHLRQRAMVRMQIANMLIDDAKRKALAAARR